MANGIPKLEDECKPIEYLGYWWVPTSADGQQLLRPGVLRAVPPSDFGLQILGNLERELAQKDIATLWLKNPVRKYGVVNGACSGGKRITLFDCTLNHQQWDSSDDTNLIKSNILYFDSWIGDECFSRKDDIKFVEYFAGMAGLREWHNVSAFNCQDVFCGHKSSISYQCPESVLLYGDDRVEIKLSYSWRPPSRSIAQHEASISHDARLILKAKDSAISFYGDKQSVEYYLTGVRTVIGLMIGFGNPLYACKGCVRFPAPGVQKVELSRSWWRDVSKEIVSSPMDVWVPFSKLNKDINDIIRGFFALPELVQNFAGHIVHMNGERHKDLTQGVLPSLVALFEGMQRELYMHGKYEKLVDRFHDEWGRVAEVFSFLDEVSFRALSEYVIQRRDNFSHANPDEYHKDFRLYRLSVLWMRMFNTAMILNASGVSAECIFGAYKGNREYQELCEIPELLMRYNEMGAREV